MLVPSDRISSTSTTISVSETPGETRWLGPELGEHNGEILRSLGYADAEIDSLKREGII